MANPNIVISAVDLASPAIAQVRGNLGQLLNSFTGFGALKDKLALPLLGVAAAVAGIAAAVANAVNVTRWVDDLADSGSALGISAENMAKYQLLAKQAGVEATALGTAFLTLAKNVEGAKQGQADQVEMFRRFGISMKEVNTLNPDQMMLRVAVASNELAAGTAKAALQYEAFGKGGKRIDDMLQKLASGMEVNTGLSKDFVERSQQLNRELDLLEVAWKKYSVALAGPVVDAILLVGRALKFIERTPGDQMKFLQDELKKYQTTVDMINASNSGKPLKAMDAALMNKAVEEMKKLNAEISTLQMRTEDMAGGGTGTKPVPTKIDTGAVNKEVDRRKKILEENAKEERDMALKIQAAIDTERKKVEAAHQGYLERKAAAEKEWGEGSLERARKIEELLGDIYAKGQMEWQRNQDEKIKEAEDRIADLTNISESFFLKLTDFESVDVFKALGKDLYQLVYRMLILEPILNRIRDALRDMTNSVPAGGSGAGWLGVVMKAFGLMGTGASGGNFGQAGGGVGGFDMALGGPARFAQVVGEAGPELFIPKSAGTIIPNHMAGGSMGGVTVINNNVIDSRTDRGTIAAMLEGNRQATLRDVREQLARRGSMLRV